MVIRTGEVRSSIDGTPVGEDEREPLPGLIGDAAAVTGFAQRGQVAGDHGPAA